MTGDLKKADPTGADLTGAKRHPQPSPLPVPVAPVNGETLASLLGRLAAVNRTSPDALLDVLQPWFRIKTRWHDDRWQHDQLSPQADDDAARLAVISGSTTAAIKNALPAFGRKRSRYRMPSLHGSPPHPVPAPVIAQCWRAAARQAQLARLLAGCEAEILDDTRARARAWATGTLAGRARTSDIVDANVVEGDLRRGDLIVSSDQGDLAAIAAAAGRHIDIDRP